MTSRIEQEPLTTKAFVQLLVVDEDNDVIGYIQPHKFEVPNNINQNRLYPYYEEGSPELRAFNNEIFLQVTKPYSRELIFYKTIHKDSVNKWEMRDIEDENDNVILKAKECWEQDKIGYTAVFDNKNELITERKGKSFIDNGL